MLLFFFFPYYNQTIEVCEVNSVSFKPWSIWFRLESCVRGHWCFGLLNKMSCYLFCGSLLHGKIYWHPVGQAETTVGIVCLCCSVLIVIPMNYTLY